MIEVRHTPTHLQQANIFTKTLSPVEFIENIEFVRLKIIPE